MTRPGRIHATALAQYVHAANLRHKATGRVRDAEMAYDRVFPKGVCTVEPSPMGLRLISPDEFMCINVPAASEGRLFRYTD